jgi:segregation and condensation protein A
MGVTYEVKLEVFEGPIDLLLHLITRQRVDIYDVSLSSITDEFLRALEGVDALDLEAATGFLIVAATLLELKAARLLPGRALDGADGPLLEERDLLLARLVECATYREAGAWISRALEEGSHFNPRLAGLEAPFIDLAPDLLAKTTPMDLGEAAARILAPRPVYALDVSHVAPITISVRDTMLDVAGRLQELGKVTLAELCPVGTERIEVVVHFLALLELFKAGAIEIGQIERFGEIEASWTGDVDPQELVLEGADEYGIANGGG